ncbi:hypothetical protein [Streptomyces sp. NPDC012510]|uniref:hypothetical protein n=1 Tax=Streptomyces sp. NPDC012510 TaxID=3364838 RepID=UPI0036E3AF72
MDTHSFRFAKAGERADAWGDGGWDFPGLISCGNSFQGGDSKWTSSLQSRMNTATWGDADLPLKDDRFNLELSRAKPSAIPFNPNA